MNDQPSGRLRPTYAELAQDIMRHRLAVTELGAEYLTTASEWRRWQRDRLCERLRERYPDGRPDCEAS